MNYQNAGLRETSLRRLDMDGTTDCRDTVAVEEPLAIRLAYSENGRRQAAIVSITMRTPGQDRELAAGFLFGEGILRNAREIAGIYSPDTPGQAANEVLVELNDGIEPDLPRLERRFYASSSCGVCGKAAVESLTLDHLNAPAAAGLAVDRQTLCAMPEILRSSQAVFARTGGLHAAALFTAEGKLIDVREDVGRHNALDKLIGAAFLDGRLPLSDAVLLLSGRVSFELMQKAVTAGIPIVAAVGAPSSLAVDVARRFQMTLVGFLRGQRFNIYSGARRIR